MGTAPPGIERMMAPLDFRRFTHDSILPFLATDPDRPHRAEMNMPPGDRSGRWFIQFDGIYFAGFTEQTILGWLVDNLTAIFSVRLLQIENATAVSSDVNESAIIHRTHSMDHFSGIRHDKRPAAFPTTAISAPTIRQPILDFHLRASNQQNP